MKKRRHAEAWRKLGSGGRGEINWRSDKSKINRRRGEASKSAGGDKWPGSARLWRQSG